MQQHSTTQTTNNSVDLHSQSQANASLNNLMGAFVNIFPLMLFVGVKAYKGYRVALLRKQIATLEKLWHLDVKNKKY